MLHPGYGSGTAIAIKFLEIENPKPFHCKEGYHEKIGYYWGHFVVDGDFLSGICAWTGIWRRGRWVWSGILLELWNGGPGNLSSEQRVKLDKLRYAFLGDTADLRNKIWSKMLGDGQTFEQCKS